jgi:uracil-DNA glycosylase family 4
MPIEQSALKSYLQGQIELGDAEVYFDEPWALVPKATLKTPVKASVKASIKTDAEHQSLPLQSSGSFTSSLISDNESVAEVYGFQKARHLNDFNAALAEDPVYAKRAPLIFGTGSLRPKAMLLFASPSASDSSAGGIWHTEAGLMLERLFQSLNMEQNQLYYTYFYKRESLRPISSLIEIQLRKMISKEIALVQPELIVLFGENTLQHIFGRSKNFAQSVGTAMEFEGINTTVLVDPYKMLADKNLKRLTWNNHIPASGFFVKR